MRYAALATLMVACGGQVDDVVEVPAQSPSSLPSPAPLLTAPLEELPCIDDGRMMPWKAGDNGYNARIYFCTTKAKKIGLPSCTAWFCVRHLPSKSCSVEEFSRCETAIDNMNTEEPDVCRVCF